MRLACVALCLTLIAPGCGGPPPARPPVGGTVPVVGHVFIVVEENADYANVIGSTAMPYLNGLAARYGLATEYYAKLGENNKQFLFASYFIAGVMAVGGVFGVMNTMFAAISQRKGDIGVLRLLGFKRWQVLVSFFTESLVIALVGGAVVLLDRVGCSAFRLVVGGVPCAGGEIVPSMRRALDPGGTHHPDVGHQARQRPVVLRKPVALRVEPHGS